MKLNGIDALKQLQQQIKLLTPNQKLVVGLGAVFMLMCIVVSIASFSSSAVQSSKSAQLSRAGSQRPSSVKSVGDEGRLYVDNLSTVTVAIDEDAYRELDKVFIAKDQYGYNELQRRGKIFSVENNTKVLILENNFAKVKVRFLEGTRRGLAGWIPREWLK
jgi:hypothetical protein